MEGTCRTRDGPPSRPRLLFNFLWGLLGALMGSAVVELENPLSFF